jgi:PAS domain S-box-containing protein
MNINSFRELINNTALLLALGILYGLFPHPSSRSSRLFTNVISGVLIGTIGVIIMLTPWHLVEGVVFDSRSILLSMTGLFFGLVPTSIAVLMTAALRISQGGSGAVMGVTVILTSGGLGLWWRYYLRVNKKTPKPADYYLFGILVHGVMLMCAFLLPRQLIYMVLRNITIPVLVIYPVGTLLLGMLLSLQAERLQKQTELELSRQLLSKTNDMFYVIDPITARFLDVNETACERLNYPIEELRQLGVADIDPAFPMGTWDEHIQQVREQGGMLFESIHHTKDGSTFPVEIGLRHAVINQKAYILANARDITERIQVNEALEDSQAKLELALHSTDMGSWYYDIPKEKSFYDKQACHLLGISPKKYHGSAEEFYKIVHPDDAAILKTKMATTLKKGVLYNPEYRVIWPDGSLHHISARGSLVRDEAGRPLRINGIVWDISDRKLAEEEILRLNAGLEGKVEKRTAQLQASNRDLEAFAYSVSHDLRAPLRAVNSFSQILMERHSGSLNEEGFKYLGYVITAGENMNRLIDDLLQFSRLGMREVRWQPLECQPILDSVLTQLSETIRETGVLVEVPQPLPVIRGDATLISQILMNLVDNAIKYRHPVKTTHVSITWERSDGSITLKVKDDGIGISPEYQDKIFAMFQRLHSEQQVPGTGIGLALVKKAAERMNGEIGLESQPGVGSTFWVRLPGEKIMDGRGT